MQFSLDNEGIIIDFSNSKQNGGCSFTGVDNIKNLAKFNNAIFRGYGHFPEQFPNGVDFTGADFSNANLKECNFNNLTIFKWTKVNKCKIYKWTLEQLGKDYGGLTTAQRMEMDIQDGVAEMRKSYSGFLTWVHLLALLGFLFPYALFVIIQWNRAKFYDTNDFNTISLLQALVNYIYRWKRLVVRVTSI